MRHSFWNKGVGGASARCPTPGLVPSQVHRWKKMDAQFRDQYERALAFRTDLQWMRLLKSPIIAAPG